MFDINAIHPLYIFFLTLPLIQIFSLLILNKKLYLNLLKCFNFFFFVLNIILIIIQGYLWGWFLILNRFIDLEILYIFDMNQIKYNYYFLLMIIFMLIFYIYFYLQKMKISLPRRIWIYPSCFAFLISPIIVKYIFSTTNRIEKRLKYISYIDQSTQNYNANFSEKIQSQVLLYNPISFIRDNSFNEIKRLKSFDVRKTIFPFFQRPNVESSKTEELKIAESLCNEKETIINQDHPAFRKIKKNKSSYPYNIVLIVLESYEPNESDSFENKIEKPLKFFDELKKDSFCLNQCFANAQASYEGETALSSALPVWGTVNSKENGLYVVTQRKNWLSILKEHNYKTYFLTSWDCEFKLPPDSNLIYLKKLFKIDDTITTSKIDCYTFPFITAGIEQVSNLFDENLSFHRDMLDNKI
ncbi:MAG: hypothetical protein ACRYGR_10100, partial [Janthinobacterium lividum]